MQKWVWAEGGEQKIFLYALLTLQDTGTLPSSLLNWNRASNVSSVVSGIRITYKINVEIKISIAMKMHMDHRDSTCFKIRTPSSCNHVDFLEIDLQNNEKTLTTRVENVDELPWCDSKWPDFWRVASTFKKLSPANSRKKMLCMGKIILNNTSFRHDWTDPWWINCMCLRKIVYPTLYVSIN